VTETHVNRDGTTLPWDGVHDGLRQISPPGQSEGLLPGLYLDDLTALQVGLARVLVPLTFTTIDRRALVESGLVETNTFQFQRVFLDWPDTEDDRIPAPSATIMAPSGVSLNLPGPLSGQQLLEGTLDVYAPGTVLRKLGETACTIEVVVVVSHKDERSAVRRGLIEAFMAEPDEERSGRRVLVAEYFGRLARFDLRAIDYPDNPTDAQQKQWAVSAKFDADIEVVKLVATPGMLRPTSVAVEVT
jgi:hypothetical protein